MQNHQLPTFLFFPFFSFPFSFPSSFSYLSMKLLRSHMGFSQKRATIITVALFLLSFLAFFSILLLHKDKITQWTSHLSMLPLFCVLVALALGLVAAARATMVTWITVLVLLAFTGNRRGVLVKRGRTITNELAVSLVGVLVKQRGFVAVACAIIFSLMAVIGIIKVD